jgi:hypothetical protein
MHGKDIPRRWRGFAALGLNKYRRIRRLAGPPSPRHHGPLWSGTFLRGGCLCLERLEQPSAALSNHSSAPRMDAFMPLIATGVCCSFNISPRTSWPTGRTAPGQTSARVGKRSCTWPTATMGSCMPFAPMAPCSTIGIWRATAPRAGPTTEWGSKSGWAGVGRIIVGCWGTPTASFTASIRVESCRSTATPARTRPPSGPMRVKPGSWAEAGSVINESSPDVTACSLGSLRRATYTITGIELATARSIGKHRRKDYTWAKAGTVTAGFFRPAMASSTRLIVRVRSTFLR